MFNFIGRFGVLFLSFLANIVVARTLTVYEFGLYSYLLAIVTLVLVFSSAGVNPALNRFVPELNARQEYALVIDLIKKSFKIVLLIGSVALLFLFVYSTLVGDAIAFYLRLCLLLAFAGLLTTICGGVLSGCFSHRLLNVLEISLSSAYLFSLLLVFYAGLSLFGVFLVLIVLAFVRLFSYFYSMMGFYRKKEKRGAKVANSDQTYRRFWRYSKLSWMESGGDFILSMWPATFFLVMFRPMEEVGYFNVAYKLAFALTTSFSVLLGTFGLAITAISELYSLHGKEVLKPAFSQMVKYNLLFAIPISVLGIILAEDIILMLYGSKYLPSVFSLQIFFMFFVVFSWGGSMGTIASVIEKKEINVLAVLLSMTSFVLFYFLVPVYGILGAFLGLSITSSMVYTASYYFLNRYVKLEFPKVVYKYVLAGILTGIVIFFLKNWVFSPFMLLTIAAAGFVFYMTLLRLMKGFEDVDIKMIKESGIPFISKIASKFMGNVSYD